jgi:polysaccharide export outer membrane protein
MDTINRLNRQPVWIVSFCATLLLLASGCKTNTTVARLPEVKAKQDQTIVLSEGDTIKVVFPGAQNQQGLDTVAQIKRDGKVTLPVIGEVQAAGMTASELEKNLKEKYKDQLASTEINVLIVSSSFSVYVTGAVRNPAKINSDRPLTALDAIMECGGPDYSRANLKGVIITRKLQGRMEHYKIDLKKVLKGESTEPFYLSPGDILYVPEKFSWF